MPTCLVPSHWGKILMGHLAPKLGDHQILRTLLGQIFFLLEETKWYIAPKINVMFASWFLQCK